MQVYRITTAKWSTSLSASGFPARWNSKGIFTLYTASSRALACLENLVHRNGHGLAANFKVMTIEVPDEISMEVVRIDDLPGDWKMFDRQSETRRLGDYWYGDRQSCILKVPSAIIPEEFNYLINTNHPDFSKIKIVKTDPFLFDGRLIGK